MAQISILTHIMNLAQMKTPNNYLIISGEILWWGKLLITIECH
jgi:hypothetical protein